MAFLGLFAAMTYLVITVGGANATRMFVQALAMYAFVWGVRSVLAFHSVCDGAQYVPYDRLRPGDMVDKKFLFRFLSDFQYDETGARKIVDEMSG